MKNILIISSSPRKKGNSQILCEQFKKGAEAKGHQVNMVFQARQEKKEIHKIEISLGDLNGFVEHLEEYRIAGKIYATNVMDAGLVKTQSIFKDAYDMGYSI